MTDLPVDLRVRRANALVTTFLDTLGILLLAAGVGWWLWTTVDPSAGLVAAGALVLAMSLAAQQRSTPRPVPQPAAEDEPLPGPEDPGTLHVMGR